MNWKTLVLKYYSNFRIHQIGITQNENILINKLNNLNNLIEEITKFDKTKILSEQSNISNFFPYLSISKISLLEKCNKTKNLIEKKLSFWKRNQIKEILFKEFKTIIENKDITKIHNFLFENPINLNVFFKKNIIDKKEFLKENTHLIKILFDFGLNCNLGKELNRDLFFKCLYNINSKDNVIEESDWELVDIEKSDSKVLDNKESDWELVDIEKSDSKVLDNKESDWELVDIEKSDSKVLDNKESDWELLEILINYDIEDNNKSVTKNTTFMSILLSLIKAKNNKDQKQIISYERIIYLLCEKKKIYFNSDFFVDGDGNKLTALDVAININHKNLIEYLKSKGATKLFSEEVTESSKKNMKKPNRNLNSVAQKKLANNIIQGENFCKLIKNKANNTIQAAVDSINPFKPTL